MLSSPDDRVPSISVLDVSFGYRDDRDALFQVRYLADSLVFGAGRLRIHIDASAVRLLLFLFPRVSVYMTFLTLPGPIHWVFFVAFLPS